ncbi:MAG: ribonuclease H-like domain-containing protein [Candidatus Poseidoniia archaeon]|nr:ribonuclease H-like domain-containing protein [Candidatus Poseidoniia archaeon]
MEYSIRLLTAASRNEKVDGKDRTLVYLFGTTEQGEPLAVRTPLLMPYFQVVEPTKDVLETLEKRDDIERLESQELWVDGDIKNCTKVTTSHPGNVPRVRDWLRNNGFKPLAADIPFHYRYLYDNDIGGCITVSGEEVEVSGWTCRVVDASKIDSSETFEADFKLFSFDIENSIYERTIYCISYCLKNSEGYLFEETLHGEEEDILKRFVKAVSDHDPDIITGYNIDGYDLPLLKERAEVYGLSLKIGRDGSEMEQKFQRFWKVQGRVVADAWWNVKREVRPRQESLNAVAKELLGREKHDVNPKKMDEEWASDPKKVMDYCLEDAKLALEILEHIMVIQKYQHISSVSKLPLDDVINGMTSNMIDSLMIRLADSRGIGVPMTNRRKRTGHIEGGYVHSLDPGLYEWVCVLDFKSMYPSIIIDRNLCFTTMSEDGEIETPHGVKFSSPEQKKGLLPDLLVNLMANRDSAKKLQAAAQTETEEQYYRRVQEAIKILMNSVYGVFASYFYRFTNLDIGASITAYAREYVKEILKDLEKEGLDVIYGDTDSVFFRSPHSNLEETIDFGQKIAERYSVGAKQLEFEKILQPFFSHGVKKRYVGKQIWPKEGMLIRGYETRRTDSFPVQVWALKDVFAKLMDLDVDDALETARDWVTKVSNGEIEKQHYVISKTVNLKRKYVNEDNQAHLQAYKKFIETGRPFVNGMKISFIVTNAKVSPMEVEPFIPDEECPEPDYDYYVDRIAKSLSRVTDVFEWDAKALKKGKQEPKQQTLF